MRRDESVYLKHIRDATLKIEGYTKRESVASFKKDTLIQDGVIRHISYDICWTFPEIPWQDVAGMRDKLIHDYFGVDFEKVW